MQYPPVRSYRYNGHGLRGPNPTTSKGSFKHRSMDTFFASIPSSMSRTASKASPSPNPFSSPSPGPSLVYKINGSLRSTTARNGFPETLSSSWNGNPIMFSNSTGMLKPPPIERKLECTLEELCYGCMKKVKITREVLTQSGARKSGRRFPFLQCPLKPENDAVNIGRQIIQEEELLSIKVNPGWKKGTKITFEGMGNERPGAYAADVTFVIAQKRHSLFRRDGDDLELAIEIPLVKALTGCTLPIPLLGGEKMKLKLDEIVHPGYEKVIKGQGMPNTKEQGSRGSLKVLFSVNFPTELTNEQRAAAVSILRDSDSG